MAKTEEEIVARYFYKGAEVEVSSREGGLQGSWYQGTVIGSRRSKRSLRMKVQVKYRTLKKDDGKGLLKAELNVIQLRPAPPLENRRSFQFSGQVDAYYRGGWWAGLITEVLDDGRYTVFFPDSRDQRKFEAVELRRHREWVNGKWIPPLEHEYDVSPLSDRPRVQEVLLSTERTPEKKTAENNSSPESATKNTSEDGLQNAGLPTTSIKKRAAEVSLSNERSRKKKIAENNSVQGSASEKSGEGGFGSAHPATTAVQKPRAREISLSNERNPKKKTTRNNLVPGSPTNYSDEDGSRDAHFTATAIKKSRAREVSLSIERSPEGKATVNNSSLGSARENNGEDGSQNACLAAATVRRSRAREVRLPIERNGKKKTAVTENSGKDGAGTSVKNSQPLEVPMEAEVKFSPNENVEIRNDEEGFEGAWFPATVIKVLDNDSYLIEYLTIIDENGRDSLKEEVEGSRIRPYPPDVPLVDRFSVLEEVDAMHDDLWWVGVISKVRNNEKYNVYFKNSGEVMTFEHCQLRPHQEWVNGKWIFTPKVLEL